jgi:hypothetical protein
VSTSETLLVDDEMVKIGGRLKKMMGLAAISFDKAFNRLL